METKRRTRRAFGRAAAALVVLAAPFAVATAPTALATTTPYPGGTWEPGPAPYGVVANKNVMVPMTDGAKLTVDVYYPADLTSGQRAAGTFPVLLTQTPYTGSTSAPNLVNTPGTAAYFASYGYIFVSADVRGTGRSGGRGGFFAPRDAQDGVELVDWVAHDLDGSNGMVGLQGCSYLGQTQLYTAAHLGAGSPVKAMIPMCIGGDVYRDIYSDNGIPTPAWVGAGLFAGTLLGPTIEAYMVPKYAESQAGGDTAYYKEFWHDRDHVNDAQAIVDSGIPALMWNGWIDNGFGGLELYAALENAYFGRDPFAPLRPGMPVTGRYQVILGEWAHGGGIDAAIELQWYEYWLKGVDTGLAVDTTTPLHVWERQRGWVNATSYPLTDTYSTYHLGLARSLDTTVPVSSGSDSLVWGPPNVAGTTVDYTTTPFAFGTTIAGPAALTVTVTSSTNNVELMADLYDVAPDGSETLITHGGILGSLGALDPSRSWTDVNGVRTRPFLSLQQDDVVTPGVATQYEIPLQPTVWSVAPGHEVRLQLGTQADPQVCAEKARAIEASSLGCAPRAVHLAQLAGSTATVAWGGGAAASLSLPLLPYRALAEARSATTPTSRGVALPLDW